MGTTRIDRITICVLNVTVAVLLGTGTARAAEPQARDPQAADRALRRLLVSDDPLAERLAYAAEALRQGPPSDIESAVEAGLSLLAEAPRTSLWILIETRDAGFLPDDLLADARARAADVLATTGAEPRRDALVGAAAFLLGDRSDGAITPMVGAWPPDPAVRAVLERDLLLPAAARAALLDGSDPKAVADALALLRPTLEALDQAERDDPAVSGAGLDALVALGPRAVVPAIETVREALGDTAPGRIGRAARAITVLGFLGDRKATPILLAALASEHGWLKAAAATALGDLGDPAAVWGLCHQLFYRGDVQRPRDQWTYPGPQETTVSAADWPTVPYYAVDTAAADALLRLGFPGATAYLIHQKLDPLRARFRIRVLQDAVDAIRRAWGETSPIGEYNVDAGIGPRTKAFIDLADWWQSGPPMETYRFAPVDTSDPGFRKAAREMVEQLRGRSIMVLMIVQDSARLMGPTMTPTLLETLAATDNNVLRVEIARALGTVDDPRAVPALLDLLHGNVDMVRAMAAESLGTYLNDTGPEAAQAKAALIAGLTDDSSAVSVASMKGLVSAPPDPDVLEAVQERGYDAFRKRVGNEDGEFLRAETVVRLVQEGARHWPTIRKGLVDEHRYERTAWWELLRRALFLRPNLYDPVPIPHTDKWHEIDEDAVLAALRWRRGE